MGITPSGLLISGGTEITDAGLEHLRGLTELNVLWLINTDITDAGVAALKQSLPKCQILH